MDPIVFSKTDLAWLEFYFWQKKQSEKAKHSRICPSFGGNMPEAQFWQVPFKPPLSILAIMRKRMVGDKMEENLGGTIGR